MPQQHPNPHLRRVRDPRAARRQMFLLLSGLVLAVGFIYAVRQQIMAVQYGYKTESLRREREQLLDEQRRLQLALEESSSPTRLEQAAREIGMQHAHAGQIESATPPQEQSPKEQTPARGAHVFVGAAAAGTVMRR